MHVVQTARRDSDTGRSDQCRRWRRRKDRLARDTIALGGVAVILAVVLILFCLLWVVFPRFLPTDGARQGKIRTRPTRFTKGTESCSALRLR